jgi:hypothetical protein
MAHGVRRAEDPAQVTVDVTIELPASSKGPLETILGIVDERGAIRTSRKQVEAPAGDGSHRLDFSIPLPPGTYKLRFAAADASGTVGVVESAVEGRLTTMGPIAASALIRSTVDAAGAQRRMSGEQIPQDATALLLALELYPPAVGAPADLLVKITMAPQGSESSATERVVTPELRDGALIAEAEYLVERLVPGSYTIRATVMSGPTPLGTLSTIVRR